MFWLVFTKVSRRPLVTETNIDFAIIFAWRLCLVQRVIDNIVFEGEVEEVDLLEDVVKRHPLHHCALPSGVLSGNTELCQQCIEC